MLEVVIGGRIGTLGTLRMKISGGLKVSDLNVPAHLLKESGVSLTNGLSTLKNVFGLERLLVFVMEAYNIIFWGNKGESSAKCVKLNSCKISCTLFHAQVQHRSYRHEINHEKLFTYKQVQDIFALLTLTLESHHVPPSHSGTGL